MRKRGGGVEVAPSGPWPRRLGMLAGASTGLLVTFGLAAAADRFRLGDPEWILRLGSAVAVLGGAALGVRLTREVSAARYRVLAAWTGLAVAGVLGLLLVALFGISK